MAGLSEIPKAVQVVLALVLCIVVAVAAYFLVLKDQYESNVSMKANVDKMEQDNARVEQEANNKDKSLDREIEGYKMQIERQKQIVPDEKEADKFMHLMTDKAAEAGVAIRRYEAKTTINHDYYTEAPYAMELDGPFYGVLAFFDKVKTMDRIVNIEDMQMASVRKPSDAKPKGVYPYGPTETVVATFTAKTFYSHEPTAAPQAAKPTTPATPAKK